MSDIVLDLVVVIATVAFFLVCVGFTHVCDRL